MRTRTRQILEVPLIAFGIALLVATYLDNDRLLLSSAVMVFILVPILLVGDILERRGDEP